MKKKKTPTKKQKATKDYSITNCTFTGIKWDEPSLEVLNTVAQGLLNLTELFKSQHVEIDALLKINKDDDE